MVDRRLLRPDVVAVVGHFLAWCVAVVVWTVSWIRYGPEPSNGWYSGAHKFIHHLDILVYGSVVEITTWTGYTFSAWLSIGPGACLAVLYPILILIAGSVQWLLLGRLLLWVTARFGRIPAAVLMGLYGLWGAGSLFLWLVA